MLHADEVDFQLAREQGSPDEELHWDNLRRQLSKMGESEM